MTPPNLLRWDDDFISDSADYNDELFEDELNEVSESGCERTRATFKDKFTSSIVADKSYLCDFKIIPPTLQVSAINKSHEKSCSFTIVNKNGRSSLSVSLFLGNGKECDNTKNARERGSKKGKGRPLIKSHRFDTSFCIKARTFTK